MGPQPSASPSTPTAESKIPKVPGIPCDVDATPNLKATLTWLASLYGKRTISGQVDRNGTQWDYLRTATGQSPAIHGHDMMSYSRAVVAARGGSLPSDVDSHRLWASQGMLTYQWHWVSPTKVKAGEVNNGFSRWYPEFDLAAALKDPGSEDYKGLLEDMDTVALQLKKLAADDRVVLWRPLHEADGDYFWWARAGQQAAYKKLWRLMFTRFTQTHGLHNLIWCYTGNEDWYPGDDVVDIVGIDTYRKTPWTEVCPDLWARFQQTWSGKKMLAMTENGSVPSMNDIRANEARWLFFHTWVDNLTDTTVNPISWLKATYTDPDIITAETLKASGWFPTFPPAGAPILSTTQP